MARLRKPKYLTCFYCGGRTSTPYDGKINRFDCPKCDATNHLDEDGEITDPPVASTSSRATSSGTQYAIPPRSSPQPKTTSASSIFCDKCLKNQHLFTSSLAQYLPDDPSHPEYEHLERNYYNFRNNLERRYPQVCAECEPKVSASLRHARYTARTDHLRRKIEDSKKGREVQRSWLTTAQRLGRWLWLAGPALQLLWQVAVVYNFALDRGLLEDDAWYGALVQRAGRWLPHPDSLITWSIATTALGVWWNPRLAQFVRGFSKHLVGISTWYTFQVMILAIRVLFRQAANKVPTTSATLEMVAASHLCVVLITFYLYLSASRSIRTDMTRIFDDSASAPLSSPQPTTSPARPAPEDNMSMSEILDEVLASNPSQGQAPAPRAAPLALLPLSGRAHPQPPAPRGDISFNSLNLSELQAPSSQDSVQYESEMDWTPTQSKHRAFNTYNPNTSQKPLGFSQTPVEENKGPIWFRVPPAPTTPAQRIFNPPSAARLRPSPVSNKENTPFKNGANSNPFLSTKRDTDRQQVNFAEPTFFPKSASDSADPRNSLTDMFGDSFSLGEEQPQSDTPRNHAKHHPQHTTSSLHEAAARNAELKKARLPVRLTEIAVLAVCLLAWVHSTRSPHEYTSYVTLGSACLCALIALRVTGEAVQDLMRQQKAGVSVPSDTLKSVCGTIAGTAELLLASRLALVLWTAAAREPSNGLMKEGVSDADCGPWGSCMTIGVGLIGGMIVHQLCGVAFQIMRMPDELGIYLSSIMALQLVNMGFVSRLYLFFLHSEHIWHLHCLTLDGSVGGSTAFSYNCAVRPRQFSEPQLLDTGYLWSRCKHIPVSKVEEAIRAFGP